MHEQDRINAMTSYLFLGPIFLLARSGTPLAEPYVRSHAKKATKLILFIFLALGGYFLLKPYILYSFFGVSLPGILLSIIMIVSVVFLIRGAYSAYRGEDTGTSTLFEMKGDLETYKSVSGISNVESDEDRTRILASMLPYCGIYLSRKYDHPLIEEARKIGSLFTLLFALLLFFMSAETFPVFILTVLYILIFVVEGIYLFLYGRFIRLHAFQMLPNYREVEAHFLSSLHWIGDFVRVVFGGKREKTYGEYYASYLPHEPLPPEGQKYFMPTGLIGIPVWNIFSFPSFFQKQYTLYRYLVAQGFLITLFFALIVTLLGSYQYSLLLLLLFPIVHLVSHASWDFRTHTPVIGMMVGFIGKATEVRAMINREKEKGTSTSFRYDTADSQKQ